MKLNVRVVSFCHYLQGPACSQYLADMGADVIKVEPLRGAFERHWSGGKSFVNGVSAFSLAVNRNKKSIALDLKHPDGSEIARELVRTADVLIENYRPGTLERLSLGYEAVKGINPSIIYASASGFGVDGPDAQRPGQDLLVQARSGLIAATGAGDSGPSVIGAAVVDQHGGALLAMGILGALVSRQTTGQGMRIDSSLFSAGIDLQMEALTKYYAAPQRQSLVKRGRNLGSWYHDAPYGLYEIDDACIVLSMNDAGRLAEALDSDDLRALKDIDRYAEREEYARVAAGVLRPWRFVDLAERFDAHGIWFERVRDYEDLRQDRQAIHNGVFETIDVDGTQATLISHPLRYDKQAPETVRMPLAPGADSESILAELGMTPERVADLVTRGVVGNGRTSAGKKMTEEADD